MKIVCLSDTHGVHTHIQIPTGDLLIHAGDFCRYGRPQEIVDFNEWLGSLPHPHKVIIAGNHDVLFEHAADFVRPLINNAHYLEDSEVIIEGLKIWGSPVTPRFFDWAFNRDRGEDIARHWALIPPDTDILITHGPPWGVLDQNQDGRPCGCANLREKVEEIRPHLHVFGHIHEAYGEHLAEATHFVNVSIMDAAYQPMHRVRVVELA
ncbi:MAG: metallophosphoesterase [Bacteroidia bacterium]|nr:metallophosphoesterase [Bacteroidia bacterium]